MDALLPEPFAYLLRLMGLEVRMQRYPVLPSLVCHDGNVITTFIFVQ